jgi:hypothetical protein
MYLSTVIGSGAGIGTRSGGIAAAFFRSAPAALIAGVVGGDSTGAIARGVAAGGATGLAVNVAKTGEGREGVGIDVSALSALRNSSADRNCTRLRVMAP